MNFTSQPSSAFGQSQNGQESDKLINIAFNIDESHLVKHIQQVVARSLQHTRQEVLELRNNFQRVAEDLSELRKEILTIHDVKLRAVVTTLIDVRTAVTDSRTGAKAYLKAVRERRERQDAAETAGVFDPESLYWRVGDQRRGGDMEEGQGDDVDLDSERISSLEVQCSRLREQWRLFTEEESPAMIDKLSTRIDGQVVRAQELMAHLGLEVHEQHRGILHTLQSVAQSAYMKPVFETIENNEKRVRAAEETARNMCTKAELGELRFAVSDLRGATDATKEALTVSTAETRDQLQASFLELKGDLAGKVAWFDMDQWKNSVNDAFAKSKQSSAQQQKTVNDLNATNADVKRTLDDLSVRVAELVVASNHISHQSNPIPHQSDRHHSTTHVSSQHAPPSRDTHPQLSEPLEVDRVGVPPPSSSRQDVSVAQQSTSPVEPRATTPAAADDFSGLLDGVDNTIRKRIQEASQAAYYAYADAGRVPGNITAQRQTLGGEAVTKARPRSALLMRK